MMDLVSAQRNFAIAQCLVGGEHDVGIEDPETVYDTDPRLHGVVDAPAQHLESAADAQHRLPEPGMGDDGVG